MAEYQIIRENGEQEDKLNCTIVVRFGEHEYVQEVLLPKGFAFAEAAQKYADDYERDVTASEGEE